jgi:hypothetical protein
MYLEGVSKPTEVLSQDTCPADRETTQAVIIDGPSPFHFR